MQRWQRLFAEALRCLDTLPRDRGEWSFGGGTALMLQLRHRESHDIDIFLHDVQLLTFLTPRLNDIAASVAADYIEQSNFVKLTRPDGEIDFIAAPHLTPEPVVRRRLLGRDVPLETAREILAKKLFYRAADLRHRDLYDLGAALLRWPELAEALRPIAEPKREALAPRVRSLLAGAGAPPLRLLEGAPAPADAHQAAQRFIDGL